MNHCLIYTERAYYYNKYKKWPMNKFIVNRT